MPMSEFSTTKPSADFTVRLVGPGVKPSAVPFRQLSKTLDAVQRLMDVTGEEEQTNADEAYAVSLQLIGVKSGSAQYRFSSTNPDYTRSVLAQLQEAIDRPNDHVWAERPLGVVNALSEVCRAVGPECHIEIFDAAKQKTHGVLAKIYPETYSKVSQAVFISGSTSVLGKLLRVGGATEMHCHLRVPSQMAKIVVCHVASEELVRDLGPHIYKNIIVHGDAVWWRSDWRIKSINVKAFDVPHVGSIREAFSRIYDAGGYGWDEIDDPAAEIAEMRGE